MESGPREDAERRRARGDTTASGAQVEVEPLLEHLRMELPHMGDPRRLCGSDDVPHVIGGRTADADATMDMDTDTSQFLFGGATAEVVTGEEGVVR